MKITINGRLAHELMARLKMQKAIKASRSKFKASLRATAHRVDEWFVTQGHRR